jgi:hypothetical protein
MKKILNHKNGGQKMRRPLSEEDLNWIVSFALEQVTVEDVLDVVYICWGYSCIITVPPKGWKGGVWPHGILDDAHLQPIYKYAIRLIESQEDALLIYDCGFMDGIHKDESLVSFLIALEFCDSRDNLNYLVDIVLEEVNNPNDLFDYEEEILAILEKRKELLKKENE